MRLAPAKAVPPQVPQAAAKAPSPAAAAGSRTQEGVRNALAGTVPATRPSELEKVARACREVTDALQAEATAEEIAQRTGPTRRPGNPWGQTPQQASRRK